MTQTVRVAPGESSGRWQVRVPGSKSITNRALLLAAVADGRSSLAAPLIADDTNAMADALRRLGAGVEDAHDDRGLHTWVVDGLNGPPSGGGEVYCGMGATVGRFLVPMLAAGRGRFEVDAHPQLRRRPLGPVLEALTAQGAGITGDAFPLTLDADGLSGGDVKVDASVSSQFLSGLLLAAPFAREATRLHFETVVSRPYLDLTFGAMAAFGAHPEIADNLISVPTGHYTAAQYAIEPDASTASYFLASAALTGTTVELLGLDRRVTRQGDIELVALLEQMGATVADATSGVELTGPEHLRGVTVDMGSSSDVFMTLACVAVFADGPTTIRGIGHARVKESDRIAACAENLKRLGIEVEEGQDWIRVHPGMPHPDVSLPTYEDHRVAMAFALIGTRVPVVLEDPAVVGKTFPDFFDVWPLTGARVTPGEDRSG